MKKILLPLFTVGISFLASAQFSWTDQGTKFPLNFGVDELDIVDANTAWTFAYDGSGGGTYPKIISLTTNGGSTWTAKTITGPGSNALISDIAAIDGNTAWIVTAPYASGTNANNIWKTTNGGTSWVAQTTGYTSASFGNQVYFWDANNGWTAGDPKNGKFEMYKTSNGGSTWTLVPGAPAPEGSEYSYVGVKDVVGDHVWIGTDIGRILHSTDRGSTWTGAYSPVNDFGGVTTAGSLGHFAFKDGLNGLVVAVDGYTSAALYSTSDGGATFEPISPEGIWYFGDIAYVPGTVNTYVTTGINPSDPSYMGSAYSTDGGLTWTEIDAGDQRGKVKFFSPTVGWAGQFSDGPSGTTGILKFNGDLALGVSNNTVKSDLKVFPNPAVDIVNVTAKNEIKSVNIIDLSGKKIKSVNTSKELNVSELSKGIYILQVYYGNGAVENTKLIKK